MKSKITKIQILKKGIAMVMATMFLVTPITYAATSLDDSYLDSSFWEQILYGKIGSTAKEIEEWFNAGETTLYIMNETQLRALAEYVNNGNSCEGKQIILLNNIEVDSKKEWIPIGNKNNPFKGMFNGKGYTTSGINFDRGNKIYSELSYIGLFGYTVNATIKNVTIANSRFDIPYNLSSDILDTNTDYTYTETAKYNCLGAVSGYSQNSIIENCTAESTVTVNGLTFVGGLVGYSWACDIINSTNKSYVFGFSNVGGIAGGFTAAIDGMSENNVNYIKSEDNQFGRAISCINTGEVHGTYSNIGGIFGIMTRNVIAQKCQNKGTVTSSVETFEISIDGKQTEILQPENVGGIAGSATGVYSSGVVGVTTVDACINNGTVEGYKDVGGIVGQLGGLNGGRTVFTNNINFYYSVDATKSNEEVGYLAGDVGGSGETSLLEDNAYVYIANNLYNEVDIYSLDFEGNNESNGFGTVLGFGTLHTFTVTNIEDEDEPRKTYKYYYETNNIEPIEDDFPEDSTEGEGETEELYINGASIFYYDYEEEVYKILVNPESERVIKMNDQATLDSFELKLVAVENDYGPEIQLGETITEKITEDTPTKNYSTDTTIKFSDENAFVIDANGYWTIKQEDKTWKNNKDYVIDNSTGATVKYIIEKQEYIEENVYSEATQINGKTYFKEQDKIIIKAIFEGIESWDEVSTELSFKKANDEIIELDEGIISGNQIKYTYIVESTDEFEIVELVQGETITVPVDVMFVDAVAPSVKSKLYVENELETERYTAGKEVFIELTTSERIDAQQSEVPIILVEFTESGVGKYNYLREIETAGLAKCEEGKINIDGTTTWKYSYKIQEGDEGELNLRYLAGEVADFAGNTSELQEESVDILDWGAEDLNVSYKLYKNSESESNELKGSAKLSKDDDLIVVIDYDKVLYTMIGNVNEEEANEKFDDIYKEFAPSIYLNGNSKLKGVIESINVNEGKTKTVYKYDFDNYEINGTLNLEKIVLTNENNERFIALGSFREGSIVYSEKYYETYLSDTNADASGLEHQEYGFIDKDRSKELKIDDISVSINSDEGGYVYADTTAPTVEIIPAIKNADDELTLIPYETTNANEITYIFKFSEYVRGFSEEDITVNGGSKTEFEELEEGIKYALKVTPNVTVQKEGILQVIVEKGACVDQVAKENVRQEKNIIIDKIKPTLESYEIKQGEGEDKDKIIANFVFSEAIAGGEITVTVSGLNGEFENEPLEGSVNEEEPNKVSCIYTKSPEMGGKVTVLYEISLRDIAGNYTELITVEPEEEFVLEQTIIKPNDEEDTFYTFEKNGEDINSFANETYFKAGDIITVNKHEKVESSEELEDSEEPELEVTKYSYEVEGLLDLTHMRYMTLTEAEDTESEGTVSFSETSGSIDVTDAKIYFDTIAPTVTLALDVDEKNENNIYTVGKKIFITATTNEPIQNAENVAPKIKVSFTNSGVGKFNYQAGNGNAIHSNTITNDDGTTTWEYYYKVENGDDGTAIIEYAKVGNVFDLAGNKTTFKLYPDVNRGNTDLVDNVIEGTEAKVSFEIYKNTEEITDFTNNSYFTTEDRIKVVTKYDRLLYVTYNEMVKEPVKEETAPALVIDEKEFTVESVNWDETNFETTITYFYDVKAEDTEESLDELSIINDSLVTLTKVLEEKETEEGKVQEEVIKTETISDSIVNNKDITNCNLHIYNNTTFIDGEIINVDTIEPKVSIKAEIQVELEETVTMKEIENAANANNIFYTIEFSEEISNFDENTITVNGGTKGLIEEVEEGRKYILEVIPAVADGNVGNVQVIIEKDACLDKVGHGNVRLEKVITVDKKAPILLGIEAYAQSNSDITLSKEIDIVREYYRTEDEVTIAAIFDENVSTNANILLQFSESGNAKGDVTQTVREGNRITYTYAITEGDKGNLTVKSFTGEATDSAGNKIIVTKRALDGDTIIADTISPKLNELKVVTPLVDGKYMAGTEVKIEAIYDDKIYVLENNEIKLINTEIEIENEDGTKSYTNNAPTLKIKFGTGEVREAILSGYGVKADGSEDRTKLVYTYTIIEEHEVTEEVEGEEKTTTVPGDNGVLTIISYMNKDNIEICDISGNIAELDVEQTGNLITADTEGPEVENVTAEVKNPLVLNTEIYHKAGNVIEIEVQYNEDINEKLLDTIEVKFSEEKEDKEFRNAYAIEWNKENDKDTIKYEYTIQEGENGYLQVKVPQDVCKDIAGNKNVESEIFTIEEVYADTKGPHLATNSDGQSKLENNWIKNSDGIVTGIEVTATFSEEVFSKEEDRIIGLRDIPTVGIFVNGNLVDEVPYQSNTVENGKTKIVYRNNDITDINTDGTVSANFIDARVYDRAGNVMSIESDDGDLSSPVFKDIKVVTPIGRYKEGQKIEILARYNEQTRLTSTLPTLTIRLGDKVEELIGYYDPENAENKDNVRVAQYTYEIQKGDKGALNIISLIGSVTDGVRPNNNISEIYIDLTDDEKDDVNGDANELLDSKELRYSNNDNEYTNVIADTDKPYISSVIAKIKDKDIAGYLKEEGKDPVINTSRTNVNELEYQITFSEPIKMIKESDIRLYNGEIIQITYNGDKEEYYTQITVKVATTTEGVQSLIILDNAVVDIAGNQSGLERFNLVATDFTKPTIRFISEYNGGIYVLPTSIGKVEIRTNIEINEEISKVEYSWDKPEEYVRIEEYASTSDIVVPTKEFTADTAGKHILYIRATDLSGNVTIASKEYMVSSSKIDITAENEGLAENAEVKLPPTKGNVIVKVDFGEGLTDNRKVVFKAEGTNEYKEKIPNADGTYTITENGIVHAEATDKVGNKVVAEKEITNIDDKAPVIEFTELPYGILKNEPVEINIFANEKAQIKYSWDNEKWEDYTDKVTKTFTEPGEYTLYAKATDEAGNESISEIKIVISSLDFEIYGNTDIWTAENVELYVSTESEVASIKVNDVAIDLKEKTYLAEKNGDYVFVITDKYGNTSTKTVKVEKIDKTIPVISKVENVENEIRIIATDEGSGIRDYAISTTSEVPVEWSKSNVIKTTEDGTFYVWVRDNVGNITRAEEAIIVDTKAPTITFSYFGQTVIVGDLLEANIITNEKAIISYSWDNKNWISSEELMSMIKVSNKALEPGKYTLYVKAKDNLGNESKVQTLEFIVSNNVTTQEPDIMFKDMLTVQVNGKRYVKVSDNVTTQMLTDSMNQEALAGKSPKYTNLTEENTLKTGSEITIDDETKYIVVVNGDINSDGKIDFLGDIITANNYRIGVSTLNTIQKLAADINNDGKVEFISDILGINNYRIGITSSL